MACCPADSTPYLAADYAAKGVVLSEGGVEMYQSPAKPDNPKNAVVLFSDVWGWNGGRTRAIADFVAELGYLVVVPKMLTPAYEGGTDGDALSPTSEFSMDWIKGFPYDVQRPKVAAVMAYVKAQGASSIGVLGFCYGGHPACWASKESDLVKCGVVCHPSMQLEKFAFGGDLIALTKSVQAPFLIAPAGNDLALFGEGTEFAEALLGSSKGSECVIKQYAEMKHGWVPRGDLSDEAVARDVKFVMADMAAFLAKYLPN